ncbi:MAG: potassium channel family protein [Fimbriimonadaceae bacterium]
MPSSRALAHERLRRPTNPWRSLLVRGLLMLSLVAAVAVLIWTQRDGLVDNRGTPITFLDILYFTVVTLTTTGYGDIVPHSDGARAMVTFGIAPLRVAIWLIFLTTAYDLLLRRSIEAYYLNRIRRRMRNHVIICGYGVKGRAAAAELRERGFKQDHILIIDPGSDAVSAAIADGYTAIQGDAGSEQVLRDAAIENARHVIVAPNRDEACVLICLTARDLSETVDIVASAREEENIRLIYRSGANTVVAPSISGGRLMAAAAESPASVLFIDDVIHRGQGNDIFDRVVDRSEEGKTMREITLPQDTVVLGLKSNGHHLPAGKAAAKKLKEGDILIVMKSRES